MKKYFYGILSLLIGYSMSCEAMVHKPVHPGNHSMGRSMGNSYHKNKQQHPMSKSIGAERNNHKHVASAHRDTPPPPPPSSPNAMYRAGAHHGAQMPVNHGHRGAYPAHQQQSLLGTIVSGVARSL